MSSDTTGDPLQPATTPDLPHRPSPSLRGGGVPTGGHGKTLQFDLPMPTVEVPPDAAAGSCTSAPGGHAATHFDASVTGTDPTIMSDAGPEYRVKPRSQSSLNSRRRRSSDGNASAGGDEAAAEGSERSLSDSIGDSGSNTTGGHSRATSTGGSSTHVTCCGLKIKIPFTVWTFLAMAVPVFMLLVTAVIPMTESAVDLARIERLSSLAAEVADCGSALAEEDYAVHDMVYNDGYTNIAVAADAFAIARGTVDHHCDAVLLERARIIANDFAAFERTRVRLRAAVRAMAPQRTLLLYHVSTNDTAAQRHALVPYRAALDTLAERASNTIARVAEVIDAAVARHFVDIKLVEDARGRLWRAVATRSALLSSGAYRTGNATGRDSNCSCNDNADGGLTVTPLYDAFAEARGAASLALGTIDGAASSNVAALIFDWHERNITAEMMRLLTSASDARRIAAGTMRRVAQEPLDALKAIEATIVGYIREAAAAKTRLTRNVVLLGVGAILSAIAAALLARQQLHVQSVLEKQLDSVQQTKKAVAAFVPRFFLNKMGYTSITQVCVGDSAEVALTMLFADIRHFTSVAEGMTSRELFTWVQGYFRLMTSIIEGHRGNINQFIGDALFALFSSAKDGVTCAIAMQSRAQQLNVQRLCEESASVPVSIGVGLHHDVLSLGILGDDKRHTCTAISASVNLASRLEGLTKHLGCRILASEAVVEQLGPQVRDQVKMRRVGPVMVKGSGMDVPIYDIFQSDDRALQDLKTATLADFAEYARLVLRSGGTDAELGATDAAVCTRLRANLDAAASTFGVEDATVSAIAACRRSDRGSLCFEEK